MTDLASYMSESIRNIMAQAWLNVLGNPHEAHFIARMQKIFVTSERRRKEVLKKDGLAVPPFLIASIATSCNLQCKGCYARKNGIASDPGESQKKTLSTQQWENIFRQAADLGVSFCLLAGGEPLTQRHLLETAAGVKDIIFPVFTNATLIGPQYIDFFKHNLNIVPVVSLEGDAMATDSRRGEGVYQRALLSMEMMKKEKLFFGTSITVTTENYRAVTSPDYLRHLASLGCRLVFYVEYVPFDEGTQHLAFTDNEVAEMEANLPDNITLTCIGILKIDKIDLNLPIWDQTSRVALRYGLGLYEDSVAPGMNGNTSILGQRNQHTSTMFWRLKGVTAGDIVRILLPSGNELSYRVRQVKFVGPSSLIENIEASASSSPQLTLVTCATERGQGHRRLVICDPI